MTEWSPNEKSALCRLFTAHPNQVTSVFNFYSPSVQQLLSPAPAHYKNLEGLYCEEKISSCPSIFMEGRSLMILEKDSHLFSPFCCAHSALPTGGQEPHHTAQVRRGREPLGRGPSLCVDTISMQCPHPSVAPGFPHSGEGWVMWPPAPLTSKASSLKWALPLLGPMLSSPVLRPVLHALQLMNSRS